MRVRTLLRSGFSAGALLSVLVVSAGAQDHGCAAVTHQQTSAADEAYAHGRYEAAEALYVKALSDNPHDVALSAAMVRTLLHEGRVSDAAAQANRGIADNPTAAAALTAMAEVEYRKGQPWLALQTLQTVEKADNCYARAHLLRSSILRIDSMYGSERKELQTAYDIDPTDPDIRRAWLHVVSAAHDAEGIETAITTMDLPADQKAQAVATVDNLMERFTENTQTCKNSPIATTVTLPLNALREDARHINGYQLDVQLPQKSAKLIVDTAASGLYISRALADENGFQPVPNGPRNLVRIDALHIGPLEFRDCLVGVSDTPFPNKGDGFIGIDVFAPYLISLDYPAGKLTLAPLPALPSQKASILPVDRYVAPELRSYTPVYRRKQFLLVPVMLNNRERRLFALDSGMRMSTMTSEAAHLVSSTKMNFTNAVQTVGGGTLEVYRDRFDFQFANVSFDNQAQVLEFDASAIDENLGFDVAGLIGFDMLRRLTTHMNYRDGLIRFEVAPGNGSAQPGAAIVTAQSQAMDQASCDRYVGQSGDMPTDVTIDAQLLGALDSKRTKVGQPITAKVKQEWTGPGCKLPIGALLYGKVVQASGEKGNSKLAVRFDTGDCIEQKKKQLTLRTIGLAGPPDERKELHDAMPTEMSGGGRRISDTVGSMGNLLDENLNPGGPKNTVHPGIVLGEKTIKLTPEGGPQCTALLTSTESSVHLGLGSEFILTMEQETP